MEPPPDPPQLLAFPCSPKFEAPAFTIQVPHPQRGTWWPWGQQGKGCHHHGSQCPHVQPQRHLLGKTLPKSHLIQRVGLGPRSRGCQECVHTEPVWAGRGRGGRRVLLVPPPQRCGSLLGLWRGCFPSSSMLGMRRTQQDSEGSPQGQEPAESPGSPAQPLLSARAPRATPLNILSSLLLLLLCASGKAKPSCLSLQLQPQPCLCPQGRG